MAQFNQLQTSASQVVNPPAEFIAFHFDEDKRLNYFNNSGPLVITASILSLSSSLAEDAIQLSPGDKVVTGTLTVSGSTEITGSAKIIGNLIISGTLSVTESINSPEISASFFSGSKAQLTEVSASTISVLTASINNLEILGTASIKYLNVDYQSSSVIFSSGSNIFGDAQNDTQQFTGSVGITGSSLQVGNNVISGSLTVFTGSGIEFQVTNTGTKLGSTLTDSHQFTGSVDITGSTFRVFSSLTSSAEFQVLGSGIRVGNVITDSHELTGSLRITGSTLSIGNIGIVSGSGSFSGSGANLYDISASAIVGLNLARISTGSFSASMYVVGSTGSDPGTGSFHINAPIYVTSSTTGSNIFGTASWAINAVNGGSVTTVSGSYPTGSATGSLWWNTEDGNMYIQVTTPTGSTWVPAVTTVAGSTFGATFKYTETSAATTWSIQHNLNTLTPIVQVYTGSQVIVPSTIRSVDANSSEITFAQATLGAAILSTGVGGPTSASFALVASDLVLARTASYANDTAAAAAGVPLFGVYRNGGTLVVRIV
jgi:hypothetical protein